MLHVFFALITTNSKGTHHLTYASLKGLNKLSHFQLYCDFEAAILTASLQTAAVFPHVLCCCNKADNRFTIQCAKNVTEHAAPL